MEKPNSVVFEMMESLQNETPSAPYAKYMPANMTSIPSNQMILLFLMWIKDENNAVPKNTRETIIIRIPVYL